MSVTGIPEGADGKDLDPSNKNDMRVLITQVTDELREMLLAKNAAYGNSAADPLRVFSKASVVEAINVRMDDKISRMARGSNAGEDCEWDLMGYLVLKRAVVRFESQRDRRNCLRPQ